MQQGRLGWGALRHPNVSSADGAISLDILKDQWSPALTLRTALMSLQCLLASPVPEDPQARLPPSPAPLPFTTRSPGLRSQQPPVAQSGRLRFAPPANFLFHSCEFGWQPCQSSCGGWRTEAAAVLLRLQGRAPHSRRADSVAWQLSQGKIASQRQVAKILRIRPHRTRWWRSSTSPASGTSPARPGSGPARPAHPPCICKQLLGSLMQVATHSGSHFLRRKRMLDVHVTLIQV